MKQKKTSIRQKIANSLNPLKTGKYSKNYNPEIVKFIRDPKLIADVMMDSLKKLEKEDLNIKERILYTNTLTNVYKTLFGNKSINLNVEVTKEQLNKQIIELVTNVREGTGK